MDADVGFCDVCETNHAIDTQHPDRIHPGPRTQRVRIAVALYGGGRLGPTVSSNWSRDPTCDADAMHLSRCQTEFGPIIGSAIVECDIPLSETPVVRGEVKP